MTQYTKPTVLPAWAESAGGADVLQPSNAEIQAGWPLTSVPPSRKRFNWILKYLAQGVRYMMQRGIPEWDAAEDYRINDRVQGSDGKTYRCIQAGINQNPTMATAYWALWGADGRDDQLQLTTAFTTAGAAPSFTLTANPAPTALAANLRFRVKFHAAGAGSNTLNINALGAKSLKQYDTAGNKAPALIKPGQLADVEYDGTDLVLLDPLGLVPAGEIAFFAQSTAPVGYLKANGAAVSRALYASLFAAIGTTFGAGDGSTTFNLPDLRGEFLRCFDDGRGIDSGRSFGSWQTGSPVVHDDLGGVAGFNIVTLGDSTNVGWSAIADPWVGTNPLVMNDSSAGSFVNASSDGFTHMSRPRNVALLACIRYQ